MSRRPTLASAWTWLRGEPWRLTAAGSAFAATVVGLVLGVLELADRLFPPPQPSDPSVAIVLDRSGAMAAPWSSTSAFAAAARQLEQVLDEERDHNVELRLFGGACDGDTQRLVGWGTDNADRIRAELEDVEPQGRANLATAIADAAADFDDRARFPDDIGKRIVVITAGHTCPGDAPGSIRNLFRRLGAARRLRLDFRVVGLGVPLEERAELEEVARALDAGAPLFPDDEDELRAVLAAVAVEEPVLASVEALQNVVNASIEDLNTCADSIYDDPDADRAEQSCTRARAAVRESTDTFQRLGRTYTRPELLTLHELAAEKRHVQEALLALADRDLELASRRGGEEAEVVAESVAEWNDLVAAHNAADDEMNDLIQSLGT